MAVPIDRDALHRYLFRHADRFGRYRMNLRALADQTGLSYWNLSTVVTGMAQEGRLRRVGGQNYGPKTYVVSDPSGWAKAG